MTTIPIEKSKAIKAFKNADKSGKKLLSDLLGEEVLSEKVTDRITSFLDALEAVGETLESFNKRTKNDEEHEVAYKMLVVIAKALNEDWQPDWADISEYKYQPYFNVTSGGGLAFYGSDYWSAGTFVGSRLCFKSAELAKYAGIQFKGVYENMFLIK